MLKKANKEDPSFWAYVDIYLDLPKNYQEKKAALMVVIISLG